MLRELQDGRKWRELAAACVALAVAGVALDVFGLDGPLDILQRWLIGGAADLAAAADAASAIATDEYNTYSAPLDGSPSNYASTARATVVELGCRAGLGRAIDVELLAYNALSSIAGGATPTDEHVAIAIDAIQSV